MFSGRRRRYNKIRAQAMLADGQPWGDRFAVLFHTDECLQRGGDMFFDCACDKPEYRSELRNDRRVRQQERRKHGGQRRKGRTTRKRATTAGTTVIASLVMTESRE